MKVFLQENVQGIGLKGEIIKVTEGYARNYLIPRGLGVEVLPENESFFASRMRTVEKRKEVIATKTSMLADKIGMIKVVIKKKMHDDGKLYGSLNPSEIADAIAEKGVMVSKNQVILDKAIKAKGTYSVTIKLTAQLQPKISVQVISE